MHFKVNHSNHLFDDLDRPSSSTMSTPTAPNAATGTRGHVVPIPQAHLVLSAATAHHPLLFPPVASGCQLIRVISSCCWPSFDPSYRKHPAGAGRPISFSEDRWKNSHSCRPGIGSGRLWGRLPNRPRFRSSCTASVAAPLQALGSFKHLNQSPKSMHVFHIQVAPTQN